MQPRQLLIPTPTLVPVPLPALPDTLMSIGILQQQLSGKSAGVNRLAASMKVHRYFDRGHETAAVQARAELLLIPRSVRLCLHLSFRTPCASLLTDTHALPELRQGTSVGMVKRKHINGKRKEGLASVLYLSASERPTFLHCKCILSSAISGCAS